MSKSFIDLALPSVAGIQPYVGGKPIDEARRELGIEDFVKLASNENPNGPSPAVLDAIASAALESNRYPDGNGYYLKNILAERHGVTPEHLTLGNGSNDLLELIASGFLDQKRSAIYSQYGFLVYELAIKRTQARAIVAPAKNYGHDLKAMADAVEDNTRVIFIANPNNPTGTYLPYEEIEEFLAAVPPSVIVVFDEAYVEYVKAEDYRSAESLIDTYKNVVVTRTFSKAYGLSGIRIGYSISHPEIADILNRVRQPFNVSSIALAAAEVAVAEQAYIDASVNLNTNGVAQIEDGLQALGLKIIPSVANFITFEIDSAIEVSQELMRRGVIVRPVASYGLDNFLRVSIGLECENRAFLTALSDVVAESSR